MLTVDPLNEPLPLKLRSPVDWTVTVALAITLPALLTEGEVSVTVRPTPVAWTVAPELTEMLPLVLDSERLPPEAVMLPTVSAPEPTDAVYAPTELPPSVPDNEP